MTVFVVSKLHICSELYYFKTGALQTGFKETFLSQKNQCPLLSTRYIGRFDCSPTNYDLKSIWENTDPVWCMFFCCRTRSSLLVKRRMCNKWKLISLSYLSHLTFFNESFITVVFCNIWYFTTELIFFKTLLVWSNTVYQHTKQNIDFMHDTFARKNVL